MGTTDIKEISCMKRHIHEQKHWNLISFHAKSNWSLLFLHFQHSEVDLPMPKATSNSSATIIKLVMDIPSLKRASAGIDDPTRKKWTGTDLYSAKSKRC